MSLTAYTSTPLEQERKALRARIALGVRMLVHAGYALIGGGFFRAVLEQHAMPALNYFWTAAGVAALAFALWFTPAGEKDHD